MLLMLFDFPTIRELAPKVDALREVHLREVITGRGSGAAQILHDVASMSDAKVQELMRELAREEGRE